MNNFIPNVSNVIAGFIGSAIFAIIIFFGKISYEKIKKQRYEYFKDMLKSNILFVINKEEKVKRILKNVGNLLLFFSLIVFLTFIFFILLISINLEIKQGTENIPLFVIIFSFLVSFFTGIFMGMFASTMRELYSLLKLDNLKIKKQLNKYLSNFENQIPSKERKVIKQIKELLEKKYISLKEVYLKDVLILYLHLLNKEEKEIKDTNIKIEN